MSFNFKKLFLLCLVLVSSNTQAGWSWSSLTSNQKTNTKIAAGVTVGLVALGAAYWAYNKYFAKPSTTNVAGSDDKKGHEAVVPSTTNVAVPVSSAVAGSDSLAGAGFGSSAEAGSGEGEGNGQVQIGKLNKEDKVKIKTSLGGYLSGKSVDYFDKIKKITLPDSFSLFLVPIVEGERNNVYMPFICYKTILYSIHFIEIGDMGEVGSCEMKSLDQEDYLLIQSYLEGKEISIDRFNLDKIKKFTLTDSCSLFMYYLQEEGECFFVIYNKINKDYADVVFNNKGFGSSAEAGSGEGEGNGQVQIGKPDEENKAKIRSYLGKLGKGKIEFNLDDIQEIKLPDNCSLFLLPPLEGCVNFISYKGELYKISPIKGMGKVVSCEMRYLDGDDMLTIYNLTKSKHIEHGAVDCKKITLTDSCSLFMCRQKYNYVFFICDKTNKICSLTKMIIVQRHYWCYDELDIY